jgi:hypothetical protein
MVMGKRFLWLVGLCCVLAAPSVARADLINGGFEAYPQTANNYSDYTDSAYAGWRTTEGDHQIEVWGTGFQGVAAYQGGNFVEINANAVSTLYQDVSGIPAGALLSFAFAHRGRLGTDTMKLLLTDLGRSGIYGADDNTVLYSGTYSDGNTAWGAYSSTGLAPITSLGDVVRMSFISVSAAGGNATYGNFIDAVSLSGQVGVQSTAVVPEPGTLALLAAAFGGVLLLRRRTA